MRQMEGAHDPMKWEVVHSANGHGPAWRKLAGRALKLGNDLRWKARPPDYDRSHTIRVNGFEIAVLPAVFHPRWHFTTPFFASQVPVLVRSGGAAVLEVGAGTGVVAMSAARSAGRVVATDLNPVSVACARMNVLNNGLAGKIEVYVGDMFDPVVGERFDLILCNPPYFRGTPRTDAELAYKAGEDLEWIARFVREAHNVLTEEGSVACVLGEAAELQPILSMFSSAGWVGHVVAEREVVAERLYIWQFRREDIRSEVADDVRLATMPK